MGNKQSNEDHSKPLTEENIREISRKTNLDKEDILKWHSEFLVITYGSFGNFFCQDTNKYKSYKKNYFLL